MTPLSLKQSLFLALELRAKYLDNVEAERRSHGMGHKHAAYLLDQITSTPEEKLEYDQVQRDLGYVMSTLVERRTATPGDLGVLLGKAREFDMKIEGTLNTTRSTTDLMSAAVANQQG